MYRINRIGECVGLTDTPTYIKQSDNGCYVLCPEPEASGIVYEGTVYHLLGREELPGTDTVSLEKTDTGLELMAIRAAQADTDAMNVDHEYRMTLLELGLAGGNDNN